MHSHTCNCSRCRASSRRHRPALSESQEMELAMELLGVSSEAEWEQFLGKMFRGIGRGIKKLGKSVLKPLGGALRGLAKKALPMLGGALGSFIPIPGVGTAIGSALGGAVSKALELEMGDAEAEEFEFETARRVVRLAADATQRLLDQGAVAAPDDAVKAALLAAARRYVPSAARELESADEFDSEGEFEQDGEFELEGDSEFELLPVRAAFAPPSRPRANAGRWQRQGNRIVIIGA